MNDTANSSLATWSLSLCSITVVLSISTLVWLVYRVRSLLTPIGSLLSLRVGLGGRLAIIMNGKLQEAQSGAIVTRIRTGRTNREIADFNNLSFNTVKKFIRSTTTLLKKGAKMKILISKEISTAVAVMLTAWTWWRECRSSSMRTPGCQ
jgi:hypothetical protein